MASLNCPAKVGKRTVLLVESVLTTHSDKLAGREDGHLRTDTVIQYGYPGLEVRRMRIGESSGVIRSAPITVNCGKIVSGVCKALKS